MNKVTTIARYLLGLIFFVFGLNGFLHFIPQPELPEAAQNYFNGLTQVSVFLPFLKACEVICGLLLLVNRYVPLALLVLAPIVVNILLFHLSLAPSGSVPGLFAAVLGGLVAWGHKESFAGVLAQRS